MTEKENISKGKVSKLKFFMDTHMPPITTGWLANELGYSKTFISLLRGGQSAGKDAAIVLVEYFNSKLKVELTYDHLFFPKKHAVKWPHTKNTEMEVKD